MVAESIIDWSCHIRTNSLRGLDGELVVEMEALQDTARGRPSVDISIVKPVAYS